jgi:hypothetical protein
MGVAKLVRVGSPYNGSELAELDFEQSADTMYLAHINHDPNKLLRRSHSDWEFVEITFGPSNTVPTSVSATATTPNTDADNAGNAYFPEPASYVVTAVNDETGQESRASDPSSCDNDLFLKRNYNTITWVAPADGLADRYRVFKADNQQDYGYIGSTAQLTFRDDNIGPDLSDGPPVGDSPFSGDGDKPSTVTLFQQRLVWGRTANRPNGIWASKVGDFENMDISRPLKDDDALSFALVSKGVNAINQLVSMADLLALTSDNVFRVNGGQQEFLSPINIVSSRQVGQGSSRLGPLVIDSTIFMVPSVGASIRTLGFSFEIDGYKSNDITIFSPHFFIGFSIVDWAFVREPRSIIWAVRSDGKLLCFTWEEEQEVWGWTLCETDGEVLSVCSLSEQGEDRLYLIVRRTINGVERTFIERMVSALWDNVENTCFLDCAVTNTYTTPTATPGNYLHLIGATVSVLADGNVYHGLVVDEDGKITLPAPVSVVTAGLPYTALIETLPLAIQTAAGWTVAKPSTLGDVVIKLVDSRGVMAGPDESKLETIRPRVDEAYGVANALISGNRTIDMPASTKDKLSVVIVSEDPLPLTVTAVLLQPQITP